MTYIVFYLVNCHSRWLRRQHATCTHAFSFNAANSCTLAGLIIYNHFVSSSTRVLGNSTHLFTIRTDLCRQYLRNTLNLCRVIGNSSRFTDSNRFNQPASRSADQILIWIWSKISWDSSSSASTPLIRFIWCTNICRIVSILWRNWSGCWIELWTTQHLLHVFNTCTRTHSSDVFARCIYSLCVCFLLQTCQQ